MKDRNIIVSIALKGISVSKKYIERLKKFVTGEITDKDVIEELNRKHKRNR